MIKAILLKDVNLWLLPDAGMPALTIPSGTEVSLEPITGDGDAAALVAPLSTARLNLAEAAGLWHTDLHFTANRDEYRIVA